MAIPYARMGDWIDANVFLGSWPFRETLPGHASGMAEKLRSLGFSGAVVTPAESALYDDPFEAARALSDALDEGFDWKLLAVTNPLLPDCSGDLDALDSLNAAGLRLLPSYHGYGLVSAEARELLKACDERELPVMVSFRLIDERCENPTCRQKVPGQYDLERLVSETRCPLVLSGLYFDQVMSVAGKLRARENTWVEIAVLKGPAFAVDELVDAVGAERVMYGSLAPVYYPESALERVLTGGLDESARLLVLRDNARKVFWGQA